MVMKRNRVFDLDETMADSSDQSLAQRASGFFRMSGLFVRLSSKGLMDSDSVWSPTSTLDFKSFSGLGTNAVKSPRSPPGAKVGLGLVDTLTDETLLPIGGKNVVFGSDVNKIGAASSSMVMLLDQPEIGVKYDKIGPVIVPLSQITESEEYTCIINRGPNPKTTHILGISTLEIPEGGSPGLGSCSSSSSSFVIESLEEVLPVSSNGLADFCYNCNAKLYEGNDIYVYKGEKGFCSQECREGHIEEDEDLEDHDEPMAVDSSTSSLFIRED